MLITIIATINDEVNSLNFIFYLIYPIYPFTGKFLIPFLIKFFNINLSEFFKLY